MILLDTNVISELMRGDPSPTVLAWFGSHAAAELYISAITEAELRAGIAFLATGQRRDRLQSALEGMIQEDFPGRVLPFDSDAARAYAEIAARRRAAGRPIAEADCQIAAIAKAAAAPVATRNVKDFDGCGVEVVNPWDNR